MSLDFKLTTPTRSLTPVALGTALVLVTYVTPIATIPTTAAALHAGPAARAWILSSMSLGLAAGLLPSGVLGDAYGRRRVYAAGLAAMAAAAVVCAISPSAWLFIAARVVEGLGGAAVLACGLAVLAHDHAPGAARVRATAIWGASVGGGIGLGGLLAAALEGAGWRASYVVVGLLGAVLLALTLAQVGESAAPAARRIDVPGLVLLVGGVTVAVAALTEGRDGVDLITLVLAAVAVAALAAFVVVERRVAEPLVEPHLLASGGFRAATLGSLTLGAGMIGMASFVPTVVQLGLGGGLWGASLLVVAWAGTSVVASVLLRRLPRPIESGRAIAAVFALVAAGQLIGYGLSTGDGTGRLVVSMVVSGIGTGFLNAILGREAVASVPPDRAAMGSGANNTARYVGAAIGITLFVVVATHTGGSLLGGWNNAVLVAAGLTLLGALGIALTD